MGLVTRQIGPDAKGSKLTFTDMDNNLYYLQSKGVSDVSYSANTLTLTNPTGGTITTTINPISYKIYSATLTQTSTDAPVATVLENTLSGLPIWSRDSAGFYRLSLVGEFSDINKVVIITGNKGYSLTTFPAYDITYGRIDSDTLWLNSIDGGGLPSDNFIGDINPLYFEVRVYN